MVDTPLPITLALRTVSTLNTSQNIELDIGITMSATTGTPSLLVTNFGLTCPADRLTERRTEPGGR